MQHETAHKVYHCLDSLAMPTPARAATLTATTPPSMAAPSQTKEIINCVVAETIASYASSLPDRDVGCQEGVHDKHCQILFFFG